MSKKKTPSIPDAPVFQKDPRFQQGIDNLFGLGSKLTNFDFSGNLSPLAQTVSLDPEVTRLALASAQESLAPAFRDTVRNIKNEAANAGALESSTFTSALAESAENLNSQFQATALNAALQDRTRALENRIGLFGTGLNTLTGATGLAGDQQKQENLFNLENYQNQVAKALNDRENERGGLFGALTGAAGGVMAGLAAPFTGGASLAAAGVGGLLGGAAGGFGQPGTGGSILNLGSGLFGARSSVTPGSTAGAGETFKRRNTADKLRSQLLMDPSFTFGGF